MDLKLVILFLVGGAVTVLGKSVNEGEKRTNILNFNSNVELVISFTNARPAVKASLQQSYSFHHNHHHHHHHRHHHFFKFFSVEDYPHTAKANRACKMKQK